jgi:hypothetical protein
MIQKRSVSVGGGDRVRIRTAREAERCRQEPSRLQKSILVTGEDWFTTQPPPSIPLFRFISSG